MINKFGESHLSLMIISFNLNMRFTKINDYQQITVNHIETVEKKVLLTFLLLIYFEFYRELNDDMLGTQ